MIKPNIIIDMDGVLNNLNATMCKALNFSDYLSQGTTNIRTNNNISVSRILTYNYNKDLDSSLVPEDIALSFKSGEYYLNAYRSDILKLFEDKRVFIKAGLLFKDEVKKLLLELSSSANIIIHTLSFTDEISKYKQKLLTNAFGDVPNIKILTLSGGDKDSLDCDVDFVIEDCLGNLVKYSSDSNCKLILINTTYNQELYNSQYQELFSNKNLLRVSNCKDALQYVINTLTSK